MAQQRITVTITKNYGWYVAMFAGLIRSKWLLRKVSQLPAYTIFSNGRVDMAVTHKVESLLK